MKKTNIVEPRILPGFMELMPAEQILFNSFVDKIRETYEEFGFAPLDTPVIEKANVLLAKIGEDTKKEIYRFARGDDELALRFDLTVPLARYVAMNSNNLTFPFRRYQISKVYRGERPQKGRFREFYQADADMIGDGKLDLKIDAELPAIIYRLFNKLNIGEFVIKINNRRILSGLMEGLGIVDKTDDVLRIIDKLEKIGQESVRKELTDTGLTASNADQVIKFISISGSNNQILGELKKMDVVSDSFSRGVQELEEVVRMASEYGIPERNLRVDLSIARGMAYYTGTVYETVLDNEKVKGSVCSGGRYDDLAESFTDRSFPGNGISIGLTRLFSQLLDAGVIKAEESTTAKVCVIPMNDTEFSYSLVMASKLRDAGIPAELYTEDDKFKKKLVYANRVGVPYVMIIGADEVQAKNVSLKNMKTGEQKTVLVDDAIKILRTNQVLF